MRILDSFFGYCRIDFDKQDAPKLHSLLLRLYAEYWDYTEEEEGAFLIIRARQKEYVRAFAEQEGLAVRFGRIEGAPRVFLRYANRYGILFGVLTALILTVASTLFAWDIRVEGNSRLSDAAVIEELAEQGVRIGAFLPSLDLHHATNAFLIDSDEIAWMSLYRRGNVIFAKVLEREEKKDEAGEEGAHYANLVSQYDAIIDSFALVRGRPSVKVGQVVRKGDLLASGILSGGAGISYVRAEGVVYGRVFHELTVEIPLESVEKVEERAVCTEKEIIFFGKSIKFSNNSRNLSLIYDTIENKEQICLFGRIHLPIYLKERYAVSYSEQKVTLTESEAALLAYRRMNAQERRLLADATLLARETEGKFTDSSYVLTCRLTVRQNVAREVPFTVGAKE